MAWILIANLKGGKGDKGDTGNTYMGDLPSATNLLTWYGPSKVGSWGVPTQAIVDSTAGRPPGAKPGVVSIMPVGSTASIQRWEEYGQAGRVWTGSVSNGQRLSPWKELSSAAHYGNIALTMLTHFDQIDFDSDFSVWNGTVATNMGAPEGAVGKIRTEVVGNLTLQTWRSITPTGAGPSEYVRAKGSTAWGPFIKRHPSSAPAPTVNDSGTKSGFKNVALPLTQQSSGGTEVAENATVRWPVRYSVGANRARLHVRNWNYALGLNFSGAVTFTGAWFGPSSGANFTGTPTQLLAGFTTPADGSEYISPWFSINIEEDREQLLSVGFTTAAGQSNAQSRSGCYRSTNSADAGLASGFTGTVNTMSPFDVWLEVEVPAETPIVGGFGDSNTVGTGTTFPVYDSWLSQYCRSTRALPYFMAIHGSNSGTWDDPEIPAWTHYGDTAKPDSVVYFLGQNDLQDGVTLATMQTNLGTVLPIVRDKLSGDVYAATVTPANAKASAVNDVRKAYNSWLGTKPLGIKDTFDFSGAVSDDDATIRTADNFDGVHMLTSGHTKMAAKLTERPVNPEILTQAEVAALRGLV